MKITHDLQADALYIRFKEAPVADTREDENGMINIDYAADGSIIGIEVISASAKIYPTIAPEYIPIK
jgi:uncharacterized protein YuzE